MNTIIINTAKFAQWELEWLCSAHDFHHIERVWKLSKKIYFGENRWDIVVIELSALLHESFDDKFYTDKQIENRKIILKQFLRDQWLDEKRLNQVFFVIENIGFRKSLERDTDFSMIPELEIVEDADQLEAIGAIAIARTFAYGGKMKHSIYDPKESWTEVTDRETYKNSTASSIQHFYDKLLKLREILHTPTAKNIAKDRHDFMEYFLKQFYAEWDLEV